MIFRPSKPPHRRSPVHRATPYLAAFAAVLCVGLPPILGAGEGTGEVGVVNLLTPNQQSIEGSPTGWTAGGSAWTSRTNEYAAHGRHSLKVVAGGPMYDGQRAMDVGTLGGVEGAQVRAGSSYEARLQVRPWETFRTKVACRLEWFSADGKRVGITDPAWHSEAADAWTTISCAATAPDGAAFAAVRVEFVAVYHGDAHYIDDAALFGSSDEPPPMTNLLDAEQNGFESALRGWVTQGNAAIVRSTAFASTGTASMSVTGSTSDPVYVDATRTVRVGTSPGPDGVPVEPGAPYVGSVSVMSTSESSPVRCELRFYAPDGSIITTSLGPDRLETPGSWGRHLCSARAPSGATHAALRVVIGDADTGDEHYVDDAWLLAGGTPPSVPAPDTTQPGTAAPTTEPVDTTSTSPATTLPTPPPTTTAPSLSSTTTTTTASPTTTVAPVTTMPPPPTTVPATTEPPLVPTGGGGGVPTSSSTGPRVANPASIGRLEVTGSQSISDVVVDSIVVHGGGQLTATNVRVTGSIAVIPRLGTPTTKLHLTNSAVHAGLTINAVDGAGNLYWGGEVPVDVAVTGSWIHHPQGDGQYHTEALAGFGWPRGARFTNTAFIQAGPFNATATATTNWHGADTTFDGCYFGWTAGTAAYFTVYIEGRNNTVTNSRLEPGLAGHIYPNSSPHATYTNTTDALTGTLLAI
jgi:hypothetical protein